MENSILDQILNNQKIEEVAKLNAVEIVSNLFNELSERERDVLIRRYGLKGQNKETLETVGTAHELTRERIRQIEISSVKKLMDLKELNEYINLLKKVIMQLLEEHGGLMEKNYLLDALVKFSSDGTSKTDNSEEHKNNLNFLISKLLHSEFEEVNNHKYFKSLFKLKHQNIEHLEEMVNDLNKKIDEVNDTLKTNKILDILLNLESYSRHKEKLDIPYTLDMSSVLRSGLFTEDHELVNSNKALYSILRASKNIEQNKFGQWGKHDSREVKPKTINDKIYLVLKNYGKPMHFAEIADKINEISFDKKKANAATVHNELILDNKYILIGRGIYSLKEWGYKKGTVTEVIKDILKAAEKPLSRDEIIEKVMANRLVKKTTIVLSLMNKDVFEKEGNKYKLKA